MPTLDKPKTPTAAMPPPPSSPTREVNADVQQARSDEKRAEKRKKGFTSTILNGAEGVRAPGAKNTVLGGNGVL